MTDRVSLAIEKGIATLTLDRPEQGNTIDLPMARALLEAALHCDDDDAIRCVVITGRGKLSAAAATSGASLRPETPSSLT
jgi:2-(1,2-epoxy-1,2-dihydrophenyl)acetyl-CoA isomerase